MSPDILLNYVEGMHTATQTVSKILPFATEASWATGRWLALDKYTSMAAKDPGEDFNVSIGRSLLALQKKDTDLFKSSIRPFVSLKPSPWHRESSLWAPAVSRPNG